MINLSCFLTLLAKSWVISNCHFCPLMQQNFWLGLYIRSAADLIFLGQFVLFSVNTRAHTTV